MDLHPPYNRETIGTQGIQGMLDVCSSASAKKFKERWNRLVNVHQLEKDIAQLFADDPKFTTLNELMAQFIKEFPRLEELYTVSRDKACELTVARAVTGAVEARVR